MHSLSLPNCLLTIYSFHKRTVPYDRQKIEWFPSLPQQQLQVFVQFYLWVCKYEKWCVCYLDSTFVIVILTLPLIPLSYKFTPGIHFWLQYNAAIAPLTETTARRTKGTGRFLAFERCHVTGDIWYTTAMQFLTGDF